MIAQDVVVSGYRRPGGGFGARNHLLVLPTVVCAGMAAHEIAGDRASVLMHQHGCDHVGEDAVQASRVFTGMAANPNVYGTLLLGLGCETIQGLPLLSALDGMKKRVAYLEIQGCGGSGHAVETGRAELNGLALEADLADRSPGPLSELTVGVATGRSVPVALLTDLIRRLRASHASVNVAMAAMATDLSDVWVDAAMVEYGGRAPSGLGLSLGTASLSEQHTGLAASGAQVIISLCPPRQAPVGSPVCPVLAVATDSETYAALRNDFDLDASQSDPLELVDTILQLVVRVFNGHLTAAEQRRAHEFALNRLTRST